MLTLLRHCKQSFETSEHSHRVSRSPCEAASNIDSGDIEDSFSAMPFKFPDEDELFNLHRQPAHGMTTSIKLP